MYQGSLDPKIRFVGQKVCSVARVQTHRHSDIQTDKNVNTEDTLSGFQEFFLQLIIKDRSNMYGNIIFKLIDVLKNMLLYVQYFSNNITIMATLNNIVYFVHGIWILEYHTTENLFKLDTSQLSRTRTRIGGLDYAYIMNSQTSLPRSPKN